MVFLQEFFLQLVRLAGVELFKLLHLSFHPIYFVFQPLCRVPLLASQLRKITIDPPQRQYFTFFFQLNKPTAVVAGVLILIFIGGLRGENLSVFRRALASPNDGGFSGVHMAK